MERLFGFTNKKGAQGKCPEYIDKFSRMTEIPWGKNEEFSQAQDWVSVEYKYLEAGAGIQLKNEGEDRKRKTPGESYVMEIRKVSRMQNIFKKNCPQYKMLHGQDMFCEEATRLTKETIDELY